MAWTDAVLGGGWDRGDAAYGSPQWQVENSVVTLRGSVVPRWGAEPVAVRIPPRVAPTTTAEWVTVGVGTNNEIVPATISLTPAGEARLWYEGVAPTRGVMLTGSYRID